MQRVGDAQADENAHPNEHPRPGGRTGSTGDSDRHAASGEDPQTNTDRHADQDVYPDRDAHIRAAVGAGESDPGSEARELRRVPISA